jgi:hypothetical protein
MSHPVTPPSPEDPTAGHGTNRDGYTRAFEPPPPVDPYAPPVAPPLPPPVSSPPIPAYQPPPAYGPPSSYQPASSYQPPVHQAPPPAYQPPVPPYQQATFFPGQYQPMGMPAARPTSNWSVASLVLGIAGFLFGWCAHGLPSLLAIIFGHMGLNETKTCAKSGKGMAVTGLVLGYVCLIPTVLITIWVIGSDAAHTSP